MFRGQSFWERLLEIAAKKVRRTKDIPTAAARTSIGSIWTLKHVADR